VKEKVDLIKLLISRENQSTRKFERYKPKIFWTCHNLLCMYLAFDQLYVIYH